jgi:hypothetical protein
MDTRRKPRSRLKELARHSRDPWPILSEQWSAVNHVHHASEASDPLLFEKRKEN